jgi:hypothetical protein
MWRVIPLPANILQDLESAAPLPADPPIRGVFWEVVVPGILFLFAALATYLLYQRFSRGGAANVP